MKYTLILVFVAISACFCGCSSMKKLTPEQRAYIEHLEDIDKAINQGDISILIALHAEYDECRHYIEEYIEYTHDFSGVSYETLNVYKQNTKDSVLAEIFGRLVEYKEDHVINELIACSIDEIGEYYREHEDEQCFIRPIIDSLFIRDIDELDYREVRLLRNVFYNTDVFESVDSAYLRMRAKYLPEAEKAILDYCIEELKSVDLIKDEILSKTTTMFADKLSGIVEEMSNQINRDFFDKIFSSDTTDNYTLEEYAIFLVNKYYNLDTVRTMIAESLNEFTKFVNNGRSSIINYYLDDSINSQQCDILLCELAAYKVPIIPLNHIQCIQKIKDEIDWNSWILTALGFIPGIGTVTALTIDAADILYSYFADKKETKLINNHLEEYASDLVTVYHKNNYDSIELIFNDLYNEVVVTQNKFKQLFYENF